MKNVSDKPQGLKIRVFRIGIAINPKTITFGQYREAIGIAWESSKEKIAKVNVAVGIK